MRQILKLNRDKTSVGMSKEMNLLLLCLPSVIQADQREQILNLLQEPADWDLFGQLIERHRVHAKVFRNLNDIAGNLIPPDHLNSIKAGFERNTRMAFLLAGELVRLVKLFRKENIPVIPLKGAMTALRIYRDVSHRNAHDIDLLVEPHQFERIHAILTCRGYTCKTPFYRLSPYQQRRYLKGINHLSYVDEKRGIILEIHARLSGNQHAYPFDFDELSHQTQTIQCAGEAIDALSDETMFLHLFVHGSFHFWFRLAWLCDVVDIIQRNLIEDWKSFFDVAQTRQLDIPVVQGIMLSNRLFGTRIPTAIERLKRGSHMSFFVDQALWQISFQEMPPRPVHYILHKEIPYKLRLRSGILYKMHVIASYAIRYDDWFSIRLPDVLTPMYVLLRPMLWIKRKLNRIP